MIAKLNSPFYKLHCTDDRGALPVMSQKLVTLDWKSAFLPLLVVCSLAFLSGTRIPNLRYDPNDNIVNTIDKRFQYFHQNASRFDPRGESVLMSIPSILKQRTEAWTRLESTFSPLETRKSFATPMTTLKNYTNLPEESNQMAEVMVHSALLAHPSPRQIAIVTPKMETAQNWIEQAKKNKLVEIIWVLLLPVVAEVDGEMCEEFLSMKTTTDTATSESPKVIYTSSLSNCALHALQQNSTHVSPQFNVVLMDWEEIARFDKQKQHPVALHRIEVSTREFAARDIPNNNDLIIKTPIDLFAYLSPYLAVPSFYSMGSQGEQITADVGIDATIYAKEGPNPQDEAMILIHLGERMQKIHHLQQQQEQQQQQRYSQYEYSRTRGENGLALRRFQLVDALSNIGMERITDFDISLRKSATTTRMPTGKMINSESASSTNNFLVAFRLTFTNSHWHKNSAQWNQHIANVISNAQDYENFDLVDSAFMSSSTLTAPSMYSEWEYCLQNSNACGGDIQQFTIASGHNPEYPNVPLEDLRVQQSQMGNHSGRGVFADRDIPDNAYIGLEQGAYLVHSTWMTTDLILSFQAKAYDSMEDDIDDTEDDDVDDNEDTDTNGGEEVSSWIYRQWIDSLYNYFDGYGFVNENAVRRTCDIQRDAYSSHNAKAHIFPFLRNFLILL